VVEKRGEQYGGPTQAPIQAYEPPLIRQPKRLRERDEVCRYVHWSPALFDRAVADDPDFPACSRMASSEGFGLPARVWLDTQIDAYLDKKRAQRAFCDELLAGK
jgi:hypothetical protein